MKRDSGPYFYFSLQSTKRPPEFNLIPHLPSSSPRLISTPPLPLLLHYLPHLVLPPACRYPPLLPPHCLASIHAFSPLPRSHLFFSLPQAVLSLPFTTARCMIRHQELLPPPSSTLARQPVATRPTAQTTPRHGSPSQEGPGCLSTAGGGRRR